MTFNYIVSLFILALSFSAFAGRKRIHPDFIHSEDSSTRVSSTPSFRFIKPVKLPKPMVAKDENGELIARNKLVFGFMVCTTPEMVHGYQLGIPMRELETMPDMVEAQKKWMEEVYRAERTNPISRFHREEKLNKDASEYRRIKKQLAKKAKLTHQDDETDNNS